MPRRETKYQKQAKPQNLGMKALCRSHVNKTVVGAILQGIREKINKKLWVPKLVAGPSRIGVKLGMALRPVWITLGKRGPPQDTPSTPSKVKKVQLKRC